MRKHLVALGMLSSSMLWATCPPETPSQRLVITVAGSNTRGVAEIVDVGSDGDKAVRITSYSDANCTTLVPSTGLNPNPVNTSVLANEREVSGMGSSGEFLTLARNSAGSLVINTGASYGMNKPGVNRSMVVAYSQNQWVLAGYDYKIDLTNSDEHLTVCSIDYIRGRYRRPNLLNFRVGVALPAPLVNSEAAVRRIPVHALSRTTNVDEGLVLNPAVGEICNTTYEEDERVQNQDLSTILGDRNGGDAEGRSTSQPAAPGATVPRQ